jgi:hypothetical protein
MLRIVGTEIMRGSEGVDTLIHIEAPSAVSGQVGGGEVVHSFFPDWASGIKYETSKELQDHVNGVSGLLIFSVCLLR